MLRPTAETGPLSFKELLKRSADEITQRWVEAVRSDRCIPSAEGLEEPLLLDAVPLVLDEILQAIQVDNTKIEHEQICSAARHGRERAQEHFDVRELVREYQLLREEIFVYIRVQSDPFTRLGVGDLATISFRLGVALDDAMRETINAFVGEHLLQLRRLSRTDSLTGLFNHRIFYERLEDELNRARRYDSPLSLVLIDLDNFKAVNDSKGHQFGDHLLVKSADRMRESLRCTDILCRYGGDEFGVILPETAQKDALAMMQRLAEDFKGLGRTEGAPSAFGISYGLSAHPQDQGTVHGMVKAADDRLTVSKRKRKTDWPLARREEDRH